MNNFYIDQVKFIFKYGLQVGIYNYYNLETITTCI